MGEVQLIQDVEDSYRQALLVRDFWERGDTDPMYYIIDDQYNDECYCYAELYGDDPFNPDWLLAVTATLREYKDWGLGINNIPNSYLLIFGKRLMVNGRQLSRCRSTTEVVETVPRLLKSSGKRRWQFWK
jgi:hypothetical protein